MKLLVGTDEDRAVVDAVVQHVRARGHEATRMPTGVWADMAATVAARVASGEFDRGVVCCWTGTGASIAANKVRGIRAALCVDAETARGARKWNDANVLALSLRLASEPVAIEILDAFLDTGYDGTENASLERLTREESESA